MGTRPRSYHHDRYRQPFPARLHIQRLGMKFASELDNLITGQAVKAGALKGQYIDCLDFVLEGGSIESDGMGTLLTTTECCSLPTGTVN